VYRHTGCGKCQDSKYNIVIHEYYTLHIDIDTMLMDQAYIYIYKFKLFIYIPYSQDKNNNAKVGFCEELRQVFDHFPM
jgi:hypothetical protein